MLTLSHGFKKPQTNDQGAVVFPALEANIQQLNDHDHNGVNSEELDPSAIQAIVQTILPAGWVLVANGNYKQTVTMPAGLSFDSTIKEFRLTGDITFQPKTVKISTTQYEIHINDNSETVTVYYK